MTDTYTDTRAAWEDTVRHAQGDWPAAARAHERRFPGSDIGRHELRQVRRSLEYLAERADSDLKDEIIVYRSAVILRAPIGAPRGERNLGIRLADPAYDAETAATVVPLEPTAVIAKPSRTRAKPKPKAEALQDDADGAA